MFFNANEVSIHRASLARQKGIAVAPASLGLAPTMSISSSLYIRAKESILMSYRRKNVRMPKLHQMEGMQHVSRSGEKGGGAVT